MLEELPDNELIYVSDTAPGIRRQRSKAGFAYLDSAGKALKDPYALARIKSLAIPPAWTDVWISTERNGHLQATGRDARGRKQYRYHSMWRQVRDQAKYEHTIAFGKALPALRARVASDLRRQGLPREKVLATVVRLLELTLIRVGNDEYRKSNNSFGLTTLRNRHVAIEGGSLHFEFRGKSGKQHKITLRDRRLARIVGKVQEIKGHQLFQYIDDEGERRQVTSGDVNDYLRDAMGSDFTAKDFRTWAGTVLAALCLNDFEPFSSETEAKRNLTQAILNVSSSLRNTPAICRTCYVHPEVVAAYLEGNLQRFLKVVADDPPVDNQGLSQVETSVLRLLQSALRRRRRLAKRAADESRTGPQSIQGPASRS